MEQVSDYVLSNSGGVLSVVSGASVLIKVAETGVDAVIYDDADGVTPKANPIITDNFGRYAYYAADGHYLEYASMDGATADPVRRTLYDVNDPLALAFQNPEPGAPQAGLKVYASNENGVEAIRVKHADGQVNNLYTK